MPRRRAIKSHGTLSPQEWAEVIAAEGRELHLHMTPREVAEGVGVVEAESSGNADNQVQGPQGHIGGFAENPSYGSVKQRLNPWSSARAALESWAGSKRSWWPAWGQWEKGEEGGPGPTRYKTYLGVAQAALGQPVTAPGAAKSGGGLAVQAPSSGSGSTGSSLLHFFLVALLVIGGFVFLAMGATKIVGGKA